MLLTKIRNAAELLWDSLDSQERQVLVYFLAYIAFTALVAWQHGSRERLKRELREEIAAHGAARA